MKITLEHYIETITVEVPEEADNATNFADLMYRLSLMVGYDEKNVADAFAELGEDYYETMNQSPSIFDDLSDSQRQQICHEHGQPTK